MRFVVVAASLLIAAPAFAQNGGLGTTPATASGATLSDQAEVPSGPSSAASNDGDHLICRRVETDSSSHMGTRRVCLTAEGWRQQQRRN
jgi:hypothetical protein